MQDPIDSVYSCYRLTLFHMGWRVFDKIFDFERHAWDSFCEIHPDMRVAHSCLENVLPFCFWSLANQFPDLVNRFHIQVRLMSNFGLSGCIPWLQNTDGAICLICKEEIENVTHFLLDYSYFRNNFDSLWNKLKLRIAQSNQTDGVYICNFITNLDRNNKGLLFRWIVKQTPRLIDLYQQPLARSINFVKKGYLNWRHHG